MLPELPGVSKVHVLNRVMPAAPFWRVRTESGPELVASTFSSVFHASTPWEELRTNRTKRTNTRIEPDLYTAFREFGYCTAKTKTTPTSHGTHGATSQVINIHPKDTVRPLDKSKTSNPQLIPSAAP